MRVPSSRLAALAILDHPDKCVFVFGELRMERDSVGLSGLGIELFQINEEIGLGSVFVGGDGPNFSVLLDDDDSLRAWDCASVQGRFESDPGEGSLDDVWVRRFRRTLNVRGGPTLRLGRSQQSGQTGQDEKKTRAGNHSSPCHKLWRSLSRGLAGTKPAVKLFYKSANRDDNLPSRFSLLNYVDPFVSDRHGAERLPRRCRACFYQ